MTIQGTVLPEFRALVCWLGIALVCSAASTQTVTAQTVTAQTVTAQTVTARSGEHDGFTRIVLEFGAAVDWQVGRMPDGYALRINGSAPGYDLSNVFNRIGKSRLGAIWADPENGDLVFSANCPCHAIAFEFRPGTVVIDLKDGAPPTGSGFETALTGTAEEAATDRAGDTAGGAAPMPQSQVDEKHAQLSFAPDLPEFDWTRTKRSPDMPVADPDAAEASAAAEEAAPVPMGDDPMPGGVEPTQTQAALAAFEENLRTELAGAASGGIVDLVDPKSIGKKAVDRNGEVLDQFRIGRKGDAALGQTTTRQADLGAAGDTCVPDDALAIASWGDSEKPIADQIADKRSGLVGEFDAVDLEKLRIAVQFNLYLGFGAEAQDLLTTFGLNDSETALWSAMARVLEGEPETAGLFDKMLACQGPAALWAILANDQDRLSGFDRQPVLLAFSALPIHLRRHLGPKLVDRFLALGDAEGARILSEAIFRPGAVGAPGIALMKARISLKGGNAAETEAILREQIAAGGPDQAEAYFALTELLAQLRKPMTAADATAIASLVAEQEPDENTLRLLALSQAASGAFNAAFGPRAMKNSQYKDLWGQLAILGTDDDLLRHAVLPADQQPGEILGNEATMIAERLLELGLPRESARWLAWAGGATNDPEGVVLASRTKLALGQTTEALALLNDSEVQDETTRDLVIAAHEAAGDLAGLAAALEPTDPRRAAALGRAGDWQGLARNGQGLWADLASEIAGSGPADGDEPQTGPLARSSQLVEDSSLTRTRIKALLAETAAPES